MKSISVFILNFYACCVACIQLLNDTYDIANVRWIHEPVPNNTIRVMTFNTYRCGSYMQNGFDKVLKYIEITNADIVALQEIDYYGTGKESCFHNLTSMLPESYFGEERIREGFPDCAIVSKHRIYQSKVRQTEYSLFTPILYSSPEGDRLIVNMFCVHLDWRAFGADVVCNKKLKNPDLTLWSAELDATVNVQGRAINMKHIISSSQFQQSLSDSDTCPLIIAGDFNVGSHEDWTDKTAAYHCNVSFDWPVTKQLSKEGLIDSYRRVNPDVIEKPGLTWSTINKYYKQWGYKIPRMQDRIDMIWYKSPTLWPVRSSIYAGIEPIVNIPHSDHNDWPSDHYAVVTDFKIDWQLQVANIEKIKNRSEL